MIKEIESRFPDATFIVLDGLDGAVIGYQKDPDSLRLEYSFERIVEVLMSRDGMSHEEAVEFYFFNIECLELMPGGPLFIYECDD